MYAIIPLPDLIEWRFQPAMALPDGSMMYLFGRSLKWMVGVGAYPLKRNQIPCKGLFGFYI
jgi:hypothetical protein